MRIVLLLLLLPAFAGCSEAPQADTMTAAAAVDWSDQRDEDLAQNVHVELEFDPSTRPAADMYEGRDVAHPDAYTVHDLLVQWEDERGLDFEYGYFDGLGFTVQAVAGVAGTAPDEDGASWFWQLMVDGAPANQGISEVEVRDHGAYTLVYTKFDPS